jgi:hypothetical protein
MRVWIVVDTNDTFKDFVNGIEVFDTKEKAQKQFEREVGWSTGLKGFDKSDIYIKEIIAR